MYSRAKLRDTGVPDIPILFDPRAVANHCGLFYDERERLGTDYNGGGEAAGLWQRDRSTILVSRRYPYLTQRWTAAHEIGHFMLHPHVGDRTYHRELPLDAPRGSRPQLEREADYFAACLLIPRKAVASEFEARFGTKHPLALTETVAWHLRLDPSVLFSQPPGSLMFATAVARAQQFDQHRFNGSLAGFFGVSPTAMAIRLQELELVVPYLYA
jgi:IrrE N-terminal-like domain